MKPDDLRNLTVLLAAPPDRVYSAWLDSEQHGAMTRAEANIRPEVGASFTVWDGYITGRILALEPGRRILQAWRTTDFPPGAEDSVVDVRLEPDEGGTRLVLDHLNIPEGQGLRYYGGWAEFYFEPMQAFFRGEGEPAEAPPAEDQAAGAAATIEDAGETQAAAQSTPIAGEAAQAPAEAPAQEARKKAASRKAAKKATAKKATAKKATANTAKKAPAKKAKTPAKKTRKAPPKKAPARKASRKTPPNKPAVKKAARSAAKKAGRRAAR